jgi:hypothetical protein
MSFDSAPDFRAKGQDAWPQYMQVLLASAEFSSVN